MERLVASGMYWPISFLADGPSPGTDVTNLRRLVGLWAKAQARPLPRAGYNAIPAPATAAFFRKSRRLLGIYFSRANSNDFRTDYSLLFAISFARVRPMDNQIDAARSARRSGTLYCSATIKRTNCTGATSDITTHEPSVILFDSCEKKVHTYSITRFCRGSTGAEPQHCGNRKGLGDCHSAVSGCTGSLARRTVIVATAAGDDDHSGLSP